MSIPIQAPLQHGRITASEFRPHPLMGGPHLQTVVPSLLRRKPDARFRMERLELPDDDFVDLGWLGEENAGAPIAVLVHGLGGSLDSKYLRGLAILLADAGWRVCALQLRGAGPEPNRLARAYHHGDTADLRYLWRRLRASEPSTFLATVGWSLGGNVVVKALGEEGDRAPVDAACAVSVPFHLRDCAEHLRHGVARIYQGKLLGSLKDMVRRKDALHRVQAPADLHGALAARDFFEFDDAFTAPLNGYRDAEDYYARASSGQFLKDIRRPTLILQSSDDPFFDAGILPAETDLAPSVTLELSATGGHVGFVAAGPLRMPYLWSERRLCDALVEAARLGPSASPAAAAAV